MKHILSEIAKQHQWHIIKAKPLSGGDINAVYLLECSEIFVVVKLNQSNAFPGMFFAEAKGLSLLASSNSFRIPEVLATGQCDEYDYLCLEYIPNRAPKAAFWKQFASKLASLHSVTSPQFGLDHDNYIGSLPQQNATQPDAASFYLEERLQPQLAQSGVLGFTFPKAASAFKNIAKEIPQEPASLIHGDLWSGNFLASETGEPVLIDPAVGYAPREMDLAMMALFGGFPAEVFDHYTEQFPLESGWKDRQELWQLYYLWVHLNIFGRSYYGRVADILKRYS
ncbi:fructosamine kinase family protein [Altibacter sp. HG106]|uniref:fructosamine kinase family protein n=1 Tax=Altibacter sp. HG106 TaxID=3023937 RepID=UPI00234FDF9C|nr:fructosamine kinase family protein [Altibacter sp. HG106]MDC7994583.1 fructosamine kinase family protein [Altibacter sp. HG106]